MSNQKNRTPNDNGIIKEKLKKVAELKEMGIEPYGRTYNKENDISEINKYDETCDKVFKTAGRIVGFRRMGKNGFGKLQDPTGQIQYYVKKEEVGEEQYEIYKKLGLGDFLGVEGSLFRTKTGELTLRVKSFEVLSKNVRPLPEKFHGLTNVETRYRQRYVDLIVNEGVRDTFIKRSKVITEIRKFLDNEGFIEVETPMLVSNAGGAAARPFNTHYNALNEDVKLRISLELYLKRLIVGGLEKVYEIGRVFRNEGIDTRHNPEFTLMELYQAFTDYHGMMDLTERLFRYLAMEVCKTTTIPYAESMIDLGQPFKRITMIDAVKEYANVDFNQINTDEEAKAVAKEHHVEFEERHKRGDIISLFFEEFAEKYLIQPTFVMDHPIEVSPFTKKKPEDERLVERFELFIYGREMANAYSELNDPIDQRERFRAQEEAFAAGDEEANHTDEDFLNSLEIGMPPTGGIGYGIDRLVMLLTNSSSIRDVLLFPTMKTLDKSNAEGNADEGTKEEAKNGFFTPNEKIDFSNVKIEPLFEEAVDFETFSKSDFRAVKVKDCVAVPKSKKLLQFTLDDGSGADRTILSGIHAFYEPEELIGKTLIAITNLPPRAMMGIESCGMLLSAVNKRGDEEELHLLMVDNHIPAGAKLY